MRAFFMQTENPAGRILYVTGNLNSNRLIILKEEKALYQKVDTNLNFVDREKKVEEFWKENHIFEKSMENLSLPDASCLKVLPRVLRRAAYFGIPLSSLPIKTAL